jgi:hypothetical protein
VVASNGLVPVVHVVKRGEHIAAIVSRFGFENFSMIWQHANNAALRALRENPHQLVAGDELFIPDRVLPVFSRVTAAVHDFRVQIDRIALNLRFLDQSDKPRSGVAVKLRVEGPQASSARSQPATTDGDGRLSVEIKKSAVVGSLVIDEQEFALQIGLLDPLSTDSGLIQRLNNLGYFVPPDVEGDGDGDGDETDADDDRDEDELRSAIEEFQCDHALKVTGKRDAATEAKLLQLHGS